MPIRRKPVRTQLGLRSRVRSAYLVSADEVVLSKDRPTKAHGYAANALRDLVVGTSLWVLEGEIWFTKSDSAHPVTGEPIALRNDEVLVVDGKVIMTLSFDEVSEAWLRAFVRTSKDVQHAEAEVLRGAGFTELRASTREQETALAAETLLEVERGRRAPSPDESVKTLFEQTQAKRPGASWSLEVAAFRARNLPAWRYARALSDGKTDLAKMYAGRVKV